LPTSPRCALPHPRPARRSVSSKRVASGRAGQQQHLRQGLAVLHRAGAYNHSRLGGRRTSWASRRFILVHAVSARGQPGTLQAMFEYQSLVCDLLGLDRGHSSVYDGRLGRPASAVPWPSASRVASGSAGRQCPSAVARRSCAPTSRRAVSTSRPARSASAGRLREQRVLELVDEHHGVRRGPAAGLLRPRA